MKYEYSNINCVVIVPFNSKSIGFIFDYQVYSTIELQWVVGRCGGHYSGWFGTRCGDRFGWQGGQYGGADASDAVLCVWCSIQFSFVWCDFLFDTTIIDSVMAIQLLVWYSIRRRTIRWCWCLWCGALCLVFETVFFCSVWFSFWYDNYWFGDGYDHRY